MTDERAKRFPLALADLVREPRKPGDAREDSRASSRDRRASGALRSVAGPSRVANGDAEASRDARRRRSKPAKPVDPRVRPPKPSPGRRCSRVVSESQPEARRPPSRITLRRRAARGASPERPSRIAFAVQRTRRAECRVDERRMRLPRNGFANAWSKGCARTASPMRAC